MGAVITAPPQPAPRWAKWRAEAGQMSWLAAGKVMLIASNIATQVFLAERLALDVYGILVALIGAQIIVSRILLLGTNTGMIRFRTVDEFRERPHRVVRAGFVILAATSGLLAMGVLLTPAAGRWLHWPSWAVYSLAIGGAGMALVDYIYSHRLALLHYKSAAFTQAGTGSVRLALTAAVALANPGNPVSVFFVYAGSSLASGIVQLPSVLGEGRGWPDRALIARLLRYSSLCGATDILNTLALYLGTLLLAFAERRDEAGLYGFALTMSLGFFVAYGSVKEYLLPRVSLLKGIRELPGFFRRALILCAAIAACGAAAIPAGAALVPRFFRPDLWHATPVFWLLSASMLLLIVQAPLEMACQYMLRADLVVWNWVFRVAAGAVLGALAIPGGPGAALRMAAAQLAAGAVALAMLAAMTWAAYQAAQASGSAASLREGRPGDWAT